MRIKHQLPKLQEAKQEIMQSASIYLKGAKHANCRFFYCSTILHYYMIARIGLGVGCTSLLRLDVQLEELRCKNTGRHFFKNFIPNLIKTNAKNCYLLDVESKNRYRYLKKMYLYGTNGIYKPNILYLQYIHKSNK
jgi:hypothetical protein